MIVKSSLSQTVDAINDALFHDTPLPRTARMQAATWIAGRQGLPGAYADTFAGFPAERTDGIVAFTGERFTSASARHILGEEASRALRLLGVQNANVTRALARADQGIMQCLERAATDGRNANPGTYCCGKCTVGLWRNLLSGGLDKQEERLGRGIAYLRSLRDGEGQWRKFPYWYTVLALNDIDLPEATRELKYASRTLDDVSRRTPPSSVYARRRHSLASRALARI